jgi:hypothetical protein
MLPDDGGRSSRPFFHELDGYAALAATLGLDTAAFEDEIAARASFLEALAEGGVCDPPSVAAEVHRFGS